MEIEQLSNGILIVGIGQAFILMAIALLGWRLEGKINQLRNQQEVLSNDARVASQQPQRESQQQ